MIMIYYDYMYHILYFTTDYCILINLTSLQRTPQQSSTIPSTGMEQEGEPGNPQENHDCRQVHFRESSEWLAATSQVARYKNYKIKK